MDDSIGVFLVGASILIFVHNTYLFVCRWYYQRTKISIEVIDISRQISLVNRSRDHSTKMAESSDTSIFLYLHILFYNITWKPHEVVSSRFHILE